MDYCEYPEIYPSCEDCIWMQICDASVYMEVQEKEKKRNANNDSKKAEM